MLCKINPVSVATVRNAAQANPVKKLLSILASETRILNAIAIVSFPRALHRKKMFHDQPVGVELDGREAKRR